MQTQRSYRDPALSEHARVADLLGRMTVPEKIAQLGAIWAFEIVVDGRLDLDRLAALGPYGLGEITRLAGSTNLTAMDAARTANEIQRYFVEETRLGIPTIFHEESLHGLLARDAPCFQQSIGAAATWDPDLVESVALTIRRRMLATGARHTLAPVFDIARDPRWGRIEETYGEDPFLAATMGTAYVRGIQGASLAEGAIATGKHFAGHALAEGGRNQNPASVGWRELRDEQLLPFEAAIAEAGLASVMPAYCDVDGVPCHASHELLTAILRNEWGFDGIVASDYIGIEQLAGQHGLTKDLGVAAAMALHAGVDLELPRYVAYAEPLERAIADGRVAEAVLDVSVERVLLAKMRLGLFERPYVDEPTPAELTAIAADEREAGRRLARRSIVLVKNDGVLPLSPGLRRIAVIGPAADSARELLGDYSHLLHIETLLEMRRQGNALGAPITVDIVPADELAGRRTILDALRDALPDAALSHAPGSAISSGSDEEIAAATEAARAAELAVMVLGERSGLTDDATTGEARDRRELGFMGRQQELLEAVVAAGTPVVLIVVSGRPLAIEWAAEHCAAILLAWVPGDEGPDAIADVLTGVENPGGKLPVTVPRQVGQVPLTYRHHPQGGRSIWKTDYVDGPASPLWRFGHGLSYTTFELSNLRLNADELATDGGLVTVSVDVTNTGNRPGDEVVQLYVRDEEASVVRPVLELRGFRRVSLAPGERWTVSFDLAAEQLSFHDTAYQRVVEPGTVRILVGSSSADLPLTATVELTGPIAHVRRRTRFLTPTRVV